jgi:hypothetical protein
VSRARDSVQARAMLSEKEESACRGAGLKLDRPKANLVVKEGLGWKAKEWTGSA